MSVNVKLDEKVPFIKTKSNDENFEKISKPKKTLVEEGISSSKSKKVNPVSFNNRANVVENEGIKIEESVKSVHRRCAVDRPYPPVFTRGKAIGHLFNLLSSEYPNSEELRLNLETGLGKFDKGNHTFCVGNHIVLVSRGSPMDPINIAITDVSKKPFAKGSFGNIYSVKVLGSALENTVALKLSRKKRSKLEKQNGMLEPTPAGIRAKESIEDELQVIDYIRQATNNFIGLNVETYGEVNFNDQFGYFMKRFEGDGIDFLANYPQQPPAVKDHIMWQVLVGWETMRKVNLVHRDIKPDNILIRLNGNEIKAPYPAFDAVLTDFGNTVVYDNFVPQKPCSSLNSVFGSGTPRYMSEKYIKIAKQLLTKLENLNQKDEGFEEIVNNIRKLLHNSDKFAMAVTLYMLWIENPPDFKSFSNETFFTFDKETLNTEKFKKIENMKQELLSVSMHYSKNRYDDSERIAQSIITPIMDGLETPIVKES